MEDQSQEVTGTPAERLGRRLDYLLVTVPSPSGGRWTNVELSNLLGERGIPTSAPYISMLRHGQRANPSLVIVDGIADIFGVPVAYFYDDDLATRLDKDLAMLSAFRNVAAQRIALRTTGMSDHVLEEILAIMDAVRKSHGLPTADD
jgi:transcriptional regulator with XRE-family HTH domain